ncbi:TonB family protein [Rufibacter immobilis]|uniref:TonB family protein n=1 Tax=Rufibacter immobilis TaxID=1348778 RepID=A0A3M9MRB2_9BACT|nr:TonB family protein [Rufibacter immobilis]
MYYKYTKVNNKTEGEAIGYYANGQVKRQETYKDGELVTGACFAEDGSSIKYFSHFTHPDFPGGTAILMKLVSSNFKLPAEAIQRGVSGVTVVGFNVTKNGDVEDIRFLKSVHPSLDTEALRVVNLLPKFTPATEEGNPIDFTYSLPIRVKLNKPSHQKPNHLDRTSFRR